MRSSMRHSFWEDICLHSYELVRLAKKSNNVTRRIVAMMSFEEVVAQQREHSKTQPKGSGPCGWKMNQAPVRTFSMMVLSLILVLAWESTRPYNFAFTRKTKVIQFHFGEAEKSQALLASEQLEGLGEKTPETYWKMIANHSVQDPDDVVSRALQQTAKSLQRLPVATTGPNTTEAAKISHDVESEGLESNMHDERTDEDAEKIVRRTNSSGGNVCDFSKGHWVQDEERPLYSGKECRAYLSKSWACREMNRPGFDYEKLRWQPEGCDLPFFTSVGFLQRLRNKVVAFVGDSLGQQQFQSLMCMISQGKHDEQVEDVAETWRPSVRWAYRFRRTNTTVLFSWSASLCEIDYGNPNEQEGYAAMHLDRPADFLRNSLHLLDVLILNTGHHWNRGKLQSNKWHPYVDGQPLTSHSKLTAMGEALDFTVHKVIQWLDAQLAVTSKQPTVFMRTLSPRHFKNGEWDSGGSCDATRPLNQPESNVVPAVYKGPMIDRVAENAVLGTSVKLLNITHLSRYREDAHISKYGRGKDSKHQDCLHWCLPGVPDVWNELLYAYLVRDPSLSPLLRDQ